jgi:NAD/NADP transhydrogenase beta subunit
MNKEQILKLIIGVAIFLIITSLTYYILSPLTHATNTTTNATAGMTPKTITNTTSDVSPLTNIYRIVTSITAGGVIGIVTLSFLYPADRH